ncbi:MAG TPA: hypothetical protein PKI19_04475 [Elusimicrobiales bacterium]|nr:hypothetical protein [Elusimicrobiales bacterium]
MKNLVLVLLLAVAAASAQEPAPAAAPAQPGKYDLEITETVRNLFLLLEHGTEVPPAKLDALAAEIKKFNGRVKDTLGDEILKAAAAKEKDRENRARTEAAKKTLQDLRVRLQIHYAAKGGAYPENLAALDGAIPVLSLPEHGQTADVKVIDSKKYDKDLSKAVSDSGGWLYFSAPGSANYGLLLLDCAHKDPDGTEFYKY